MSHAKGIKTWLSDVTGFTPGQIIKANQNGPRPSGEYITFSIDSNIKASNAFLWREEKDVDTTYLNFYTPKEIIVSINIYSKDGEVLHSKLDASFNLYFIRLALKEENLVLIEGSSVNNLTGLGDTKFIPRFQADYRFRAGETIATELERIHKYEIDGTIIGLDPVLPPSSVNDIYWGTLTKSSGYTEADVKSLSNSISSSTRIREITINALAGQYIIYASPVRFGMATFRVYGFVGGFQTPETVSITNAALETEDYYVWRSDNSGLGSTTITIG